MSSHNTALLEVNQSSAGQYSTLLSQTSDVLLQACGLGPEACGDRLHTTLIRRRGRPQQVGRIHLWSSLLLCAVQGMHSFADWRRLVGLQQIGPFAPVWLTRNGLVKRLLQAGLDPLQDLWEMINLRLAHIGSWAISADVAAFASGIFALDETRLDTIGRYLKPLRGLGTQDPACFAGNWWVSLICATSDGHDWSGARMFMKTVEWICSAFFRDSRLAVCSSSISAISASLSLIP